MGFPANMKLGSADSGVFFSLILLLLGIVLILVGSSEFEELGVDKTKLLKIGVIVGLCAILLSILLFLGEYDSGVMDLYTYLGADASYGLGLYIAILSLLVGIADLTLDLLGKDKPYLPAIGS